MKRKAKNGNQVKKENNNNGSSMSNQQNKRQTGKIQSNHDTGWSVSNVSSSKAAAQRKRATQAAARNDDAMYESVLGATRRGRSVGQRPGDEASVDKATTDGGDGTTADGETEASSRLETTQLTDERIYNAVQTTVDGSTPRVVT